MKLIAVLAVACGSMVAPVITAGNASAQPFPAIPGPCDGKECVPHVKRDVVPGAECNPVTRYAFGLDAKGGTFICSGKRQWVPTKPLVGVRNTAAPCNADPGSAQSVDGLPMSCKAGGWTADYDDIFYPPSF